MIIYTIDEFPPHLKEIADAKKAALTDTLRANFDIAIASDVIMSSDERIERMLDSFKIPVSDDMSYNRYYFNAQKDLEGEAAKDAVKKQIIPVLPTIEDIHVLARKRYDEKNAKDLVKEQAKAEKEAKKQK
jgi:hypothetical protein